MDRSHEFNPPASNWLARAYYTPLSDALRGHLSARLDVRREIAAAELAGPISGLIDTVVRRTRLWRGEKLDVARELVAHFADGLAAGRSVERLVEDFGSTRQAAKLIRKAKRRGRPLYWQTWWYFSRGLVALLGISIIAYALLSARFYLSRPTIAHNYWHEINAARRVPQDQRAWPVYRRALLKLDKDDSAFVGNHWDEEPGGKHWQQLAAALQRQREPIELAREAAAKPCMGYLLGDPADRAATRRASAGRLLSSGGPLADENRELVTANLDGMLALRSLAWLLVADARRAAADDDGETLMADLSAAISMSQQVFQPDATLVEQLIGLAIFDMACETTGRILTDHPSALSDRQLRDLAHELSAYRDGDIAIDFTSEKIIFDDMLQRSYTDSGAGDGRFTPAGVRNLHVWGTRQEETDVTVDLVSPGVAAFVGSRAENRELFHSSIDEMVAAHQGPPWLWDSEVTDGWENQLKQLMRSRTGRLRYAMVLLWLPAMPAAFSAGERSIQQRDATELAIGLVLWNRRHGAWPETLEQLVPDLLPAIPPDRFDGQPLRYVVRDGRPVIYSIGHDRDDDGGRPTDPPSNAVAGSYGPLKSDQIKSVQESGSYDGDWILWPPQKPAEEHAE